MTNDEIRFDERMAMSKDELSIQTSDLVICNESFYPSAPTIILT